VPVRLFTPTLRHASELLTPIEINRMNSVRCPPCGAGPRVPFECFFDPMTSSNALGVATFAGIRPFFDSLSYEMCSRQAFAKKASVRFAAAEHIEVYCNRKRVNSSIGNAPQRRP
jgi:hypothetical protein